MATLDLPALSSSSRSRAPLVLACYVAFILVPAWALLRPGLGAARGGRADAVHARRRCWASGAAIGLAIVWTYDTYA